MIAPAMASSARDRFASNMRPEGASSGGDSADRWPFRPSQSRDFDFTWSNAFPYDFVGHSRKMRNYFSLVFIYLKARARNVDSLSFLY
jgi:hypothetical protein